MDKNNTSTKLRVLNERIPSPFRLAAVNIALLRRLSKPVGDELSCCVGCGWEKKIEVVPWDLLLGMNFGHEALKFESVYGFDKSLTVVGRVGHDTCIRG